MALSNRINFRGGQTSLGKYLYKNGVDNVALTGGLSPSGYTFDTGYTVGGTVRMDSNSIYIAPQTSSVVIVGTTIPVNLANVNSIIYRYSVNDCISSDLVCDRGRNDDLCLGHADESDGRCVDDRSVPVGGYDSERFDLVLTCVCKVPYLDVLE